MSSNIKDDNGSSHRYFYNQNDNCSSENGGDISSSSSFINNINNHDNYDDRVNDILSHVPKELRIQLLYIDDDIIVLNKPCNLRSVPGHAIPSNDDNDDEIVPQTKRQKKCNITMSNEKKKKRITAQEAWVQAIESFQINPIATTTTTTTTTDDHETNKEQDRNELMKELCHVKHKSSIPRKLKVFQKYCIRNFHLTNNHNDTIQWCHEEIQKRQIPLLNLPKATSLEESAYGQCQLVIRSNTTTNNLFPTNNNNKEKNEGLLLVVHRLDCQTSGILVFARTHIAASKLSHTKVVPLLSTRYVRTYAYFLRKSLIRNILGFRIYYIK